MKTLGANGVKVLKIIHLLLAFMWIGGAFSMVLLLFTVTPTESHEMYIYSRSLQLIDDWLIIPGAIGCFLTGLVYAIWTKWGFFKHNWIIVKWILTVSMILLGTFAMGPWINGNVFDVNELHRYSTESEVYFQNLAKNQLLGPIQTACLLIVVIISVVKPWKKKKSK